MISRRLALARLTGSALAAGLGGFGAVGAVGGLGIAQAADAQSLVPGTPAAPPVAANTASETAPEALRTELVKTGLYLIAGGGGTALLRLSAAGAVLVNGKAEGQYRPLLAQLRRISRMSDLPLRVLVLTDASPQHAANQALFAAAGVATLMQQDGAARLPAPLAAAASRARAPAAVVSFDRSYHLQIGGVEIKLLHVGAARTAADTVVLFPDLKVLAVGGLYAAVPPTSGQASPADLARWSRALAQVLELDFEIAVPSEGPPVSRDELQSFKQRLDRLGAASTKPH